MKIKSIFMRVKTKQKLESLSVVLKPFNINKSEADAENQQTGSTGTYKDNEQAVEAQNMESRS